MNWSSILAFVAGWACALAVVYSKDQARAAEDPNPIPQDCYGYCPECGAPGETRQRCPGGNDHCANGHCYPSLSALNPEGRKRLQTLRLNTGGL